MKKLFLAILLLVAIGTIIYFAIGKNNEDGGKVACTMEAKLCPDGSSVGRSGPNCEFAMCPSGVTETTTDSVSKIKYSFPKALPAQYINPIEWPGSMRYAAINFFCEESVGSASGTTTETAKINNRNYCKQILVGGAAGSTYTTYAYTGESSGKLVTSYRFYFEIRSMFKL